MTTTKEFQEHVQEVLENYRNIPSLNEMEASWSCLFQQHQQEFPELSAYQVWQKLCRNIHLQLEEQNFPHADLISATYFEGLSVKEILDQNRPKRADGEPAWTSPGSIDSHKKQALEEFGYLFWAQDQL